MLRPHPPGPPALGAPPSGVLPPPTGDPVLCQSIHFQVTIGGDVKSTKALVVGDAEG